MRTVYRYCVYFDWSSSFVSGHGFSAVPSSGQIDDALSTLRKQALTQRWSDCSTQNRSFFSKLFGGCNYCLCLCGSWSQTAGLRNIADSGLGFQTPGVIFVSDRFQPDLILFGSLKLPGPNHAKVGLALAILQSQPVPYIE